MNNYTKTERVIELKDLLYRTAKQWRMIINGAIIIALIAAMLQILSGMRVMLDDETLRAEKEKHEIALDDYNATGERLRTSIANLRAQSANQQEYNNKSELMKIDPMNKWVGDFQIYIDSKYQIDPSLMYQNTDKTTRLVSAYSSYLRSGEFYTEMLDEIGTVNEIRFLREIYSVSSDPGIATITVSSIGKSEDDVRKILDFVKLKVMDHYAIIQSAIGDHSYVILTESVYSTIDLDLDAMQKANLLAIADYANAIGEQNEALTDWEKTEEPQPEFGAWYTTKKAIKTFILGGIIGVVLMVCWYAVKYITSDMLKTEEDWRAYNIPVLGYIVGDKKKRSFQWLDNLIDRIFGRTNRLNMVQSGRLIARSLCAMLREQKLERAIFIGNVDRAYAERVIQEMNEVSQESAFSYAGDVLTEDETATNIAQIDRVFLLAEDQTTQIKNINRTLTLLRAWGKTVMGVVVIE